MAGRCWPADRSLYTLVQNGASVVMVVGPTLYQNQKGFIAMKDTHTGICLGDWCDIRIQ